MLTYDKPNQTWAIRVEWTPEGRADGWYVSEFIQGESGHKVFGPMPAEVVMPLVAERRQFFTELRDSLCKSERMFVPDVQWDGMVNSGMTPWTAARTLS